MFSSPSICIRKALITATVPEELKEEEIANDYLAV